ARGAAVCGDMTILKALVTGAGGFVGKHLLTHLRSLPDTTIHGTLLNISEKRPDLEALCPDLWTLDLRDNTAVRDLLAGVRPDQIYHLAGQPFVPRSFEDPWDTFENNVRGTLNLLQAIHHLNLSSRLLVIGSAEVYGAV